MFLKLGRKGFSLTELLIAMGIFIVVMSIISGIFISGLSIQKKVYNTQYLQSEGNFLMQKMSKEIRMLKNIAASQQSSAGSFIEFHNYNLDLVNYCRSDISGNCSASGTFVARNGNVISSSEILVEDLKFYTSETFLSTQPLITIILTLKTANGGFETLTLQNSLATRSY